MNFTFAIFFDYIVKFLKNPKYFLLNNLGVKQTVTKNIFWQSLAEIINRLLKALLFIYIARVFGAAEYGKFAYALGFVALFSILSDFGLAKVIFREYSKYPEKEKDFPAILSLEIIMSTFTFLMIIGASFFATDNFELRKVIWILAFYYLISIFPAIFTSVFRSRQKMEYQSWLDIFASTTTVVLAFLVIKNYPTISNLSLAYLVAALASLTATIIIFNLKIFKTNLVVDKKIWKTYLIIAWPFAFANVFSTIIANFDISLMGYLKMFKETGFYTAAQKIIGVGLVPISFISISFFPVLSRAWVESRERVQRIWIYYLTAISFLGIPLLMGGIALAPNIISFIYGTGFSTSTYIFQILLFSSILALITLPCSHILIVADKVKKIMLVNATAMGISCVMNLLLIPMLSYKGAMVSNLATNLFLLTSHLYLTKKYSGIAFVNSELIKNLLLILVSGGLMCLLILNIKQINLIPTIISGAVAYSLSFLFLKFLQLKFSKNYEPF